MDILELNIRAKGPYLEAKKRERRNNMAKWRKCQVMCFTGEEDFKKWLDYTGWHKRPMKISNAPFMIEVEFLDFKGKKDD